MTNVTEVQNVTDPVCGMTIDPAFAAGTSRIGAATFHFCAASCKQSFDASPERYLNSGAPAASCCSPGGHCSTSSAR